jgi:hypothetical protein
VSPLPTVTHGSGTDTVSSLGITNYNLNVSGGFLMVNNAYSSNADTAVSGGYLALNGTSQTATLTLSSGTLDVPGNLTVTGTTTLSGGTMQGPGPINLNGGVNVGVSNVFLGGSDGGPVLNLGGTSTWTGTAPFASRIWVGYGSTINNTGTFQDQNAFNNDILNLAGTGNTFNNMGTYVKTGLDTTTDNIPFNNTSSGSGTGIVNLQSGTLNLASGGIAGSGSTFNGAPGTTLGLSGYKLQSGSAVNAGNVTFSGVNTVAGAFTATGTTSVQLGTTAFSGPSAPSFNALSIAGTATFSNNAAANSLALTGGTLTLGATGNFTVSGPTTVSGGTMQGGTATLNGTVNLVDGGLSLNGATLNLNGNATWTNTFADSNDISLNNSTVINNNSVFTDSLNYSGGIQNGFSGTNVFNNMGTYMKTGAGTSTINVPFNNTSGGPGTGIVNLSSGTLNLAAGGTGGSGSAFNGAPGTTLGFSGYNFQSGSAVNAGNVTFSGVNTVAGTFTATGTTSVTGGTTTFSDLTFNGLVVSGGATASINNNATASSLTVSNASTVDLGAAGNLTVTGTTTLSGFSTLQGGDDFKLKSLTVGQGGVVLNHTTLRVYGTTAWTTTFPESGPIPMGDASSWYNYGTVQDENPYGDSISEFGGGTNTFYNLYTYNKTGDGTTYFDGITFTNSGNLLIEKGTMNFTEPLLQTAGLISVNGFLVAPAVNIIEGTVNGTGAITTGNMTINTAAFVLPGTISSPGVLTINGTLTTMGTLAINILNLTGGAGKGYSQLQVAGSPGTAVLGGTLQINLLPGASFSAGSEFDILHVLNGYTGEFSSVTGNGASDFLVIYGTPGLGDPNFDVFLVATSSFTSPVPLPPGLLLLAPGLLGLAAVRRRFKK